MADANTNGCFSCGKPTRFYPASNRSAKYCSKHCNDRAKYEARKKASEGPCKRCGSPCYDLSRKGRKGFCRSCVNNIGVEARQLKLEQLTGLPPPSKFSKIYYRTCACGAAQVRRSRWVSTSAHWQCLVCIAERRNLRYQEKAVQRQSARANGAPCIDCGSVVIGLCKGDISLCSLCLQKRKARTLENLRRIRRQNKKTYKRRRRSRQGAMIDGRLKDYEIYDRDGWCCQYCGVSTPIRLIGTNHANEPTIDHMTPLSRGGNHSAENLCLSCRDCNSIKGTMNYQEFMAWNAASMAGQG